MSCSSTALVICEPDGSDATAAADGVEVHALTPTPRSGRLTDGARAIAALGRAHGVLARRYLHRRALAQLDEVLARVSPDVLVVGSLDLIAAAEIGRRRGCIVVVDSDDVQSMRTASIARSLPRSALAGRAYHWLLTANYRAIERRRLVAADQVWVSSATEAQELDRLIHHPVVVVVPNVLDLDRYRVVAEPAGEPVIGFLGNYGYQPNEQAAFDLIAMQRRLRARGCASRLKLIGIGPTAGMRAAAQGEPSIEITGEVPDVATALAGITVLAAPLRAGGGTKIKILESMACGRCVITTASGAEGLAAHAGEHLVVADGEHFDAAVTDLLTDADRRARIASAGRAFVAERFSLTSLRRTLGVELGHLVARRAPVARV
ncbi:MAG TPA: glycosyltransferase [Planctomycetota bacterium]|nr:glycosyltransferase [Planctomycetota bacterium]